MLIDFTEFELETIYNSLDDYIHYDDEDELPENLIGGLSVANRAVSYTHLTLPTTEYV